MDSRSLMIFMCVVFSMLHTVIPSAKASAARGKMNYCGKMTVPNAN
jgi:hypothetical protein